MTNNKMAIAAVGATVLVVGVAAFMVYHRIKAQTKWDQAEADKCMQSLKELKHIALDKNNNKAIAGFFFSYESIKLREAFQAKFGKAPEFEAWAVEFNKLASLLNKEIIYS